MLGVHFPTKGFRIHPIDKPGNDSLILNPNAWVLMLILIHKLDLLPCTLHTFRKVRAESSSDPDYNTVSVTVLENTGYGDNDLDPAQSQSTQDRSYGSVENVPEQYRNPGSCLHPDIELPQLTPDSNQMDEILDPYSISGPNIGSCRESPTLGSSRQPPTPAPSLSDPELCGVTSGDIYGVVTKKSQTDDLDMAENTLYHTYGTD